MISLTKNYNHPKSGDTIKVEPIRTLQVISKIKTLLLKQPRNYCLFVLGINTAFRASELLSIRVGHVAHLLPGDILEIKQQKTKQYRSVTFNQAAYNAFHVFINLYTATNNYIGSYFLIQMNFKKVCCSNLQQTMEFI